MTRKVLALALAIPLLAATGSAAATADEDIIWLRVEVSDRGGEHTKVKVNLPLSLIEVVVDSIDKREFMSHLEDEHPSLDIRKLWREIRKMDVDEFVTVETDKEDVRVWKDREFFRINIREEGYAEPNIEVKIPLAIMDYVFESKERTFSFQEVVERLRDYLPLTLVQARHGDEQVRIWLEEQ